jgi:hypothetical protein
VSERTPQASAPVLLACFGYRALAGALIAAPWSMALAGQLSGYAGGDARLWDPGGVLLMEAVRWTRPQAAGLAWQSVTLTLLSALGWVAVVTLLIASLGPQAPRERLRWSTGRAAYYFGPSLLLQALGLVLKLLGCAALLAGGAALGQSYEPPTRELVSLSGLGPALLWLWLCTALEDAIRVTMVQQDSGLLAAIGRGARTLWRHRRPALAAAGWRTLAGVGALGGALWLSVMLGGAQTGDVVAGAVAHYAALLLYLLMRAQWFGWLSARVAREAPVASAAA